MTSQDWLDANALHDLSFELTALPNRRLHLLTAALLRRVWDRLPAHHTRTAVAATEKFADGLVTAAELARLRSADLLETGEPLWTNPGYLDEDLLGLGCWCCEDREREREYECRVARNGGRLDGVAAAVQSPGRGVIRAAAFARELVRWHAPDDRRDEAERAEADAQAAVYADVVGPSWVAPNWPRWRTADVRALARHIDTNQAFDVLPILADALQDAGCDDANVLDHCRRAGEHVRGCWVVDAALGR